MNQRIKELIAQCMAEKNLSIKSIDGWHYTGMAKVLDPDKFAELIVRECAKVVDLWSDEVPCSEGYDKFTVGKLKQHFGVE
jgi:hypothetical protein